MSVLDRSELEQSHLADLHAIASELGIEGFRRLGRPQLIDAILGGGDADGANADGDDRTDADAAGTATQEPQDGDAEETDGSPRRRGRRLRLRRGRDEATPEDGAPEPAQEDIAEAAQTDVAEAAETEQQRDLEAEADREPQRERRPRRRSEGKPDRGAQERPARGPRGADEADSAEATDAGDGEEQAGVLDILPGGSGFMRADPFVHAREDVYVSPAQIRRCELRAGDRISGPVRSPRRSERYPSLVRVERVNGEPAEPPAERPHFDELTPTFASEPLETIHGLPFGKGSRVAIGGPPGAGATRLLREVTDALEGDLDVLAVLVGVRPEEVTDWKSVGTLPVVGGGFDRPAEELAQIAEMAVERAKRTVEGGGHAVLVIDGLDTLPAPAARRVFAAARNTVEAGSLTIVAAVGSGGELLRLASTRVVLTPEGALDAAASGALRADLLGA